MLPLKLTLGFDDKAIIWQKLEENARWKIRKPEINTWKEMKELMRKAFLPPSNEKDAYDKL